MNIVEAYIKFRGQLLIFISGLPGCGKLKLAKNIARDFKLKIIDQYDYYKKDYDVTVTLHNDIKLINWYTDDAVDWDRFNEDIDKFKTNGLIVIGVALIESKITSKPDYHIHLNISKQLCMEKRKDFLKEHKEKYAEEYKSLETPIEKLKMNQLIFPYYLESTKKSKINKFININDMTDNQVYDIAFDALIALVKKYLKQDDVTNSEVSKTSTLQSNNSNKSTKSTDSSEVRTPKVSKVSKKKPNIITEDEESISASMELLDEPKYSYDQELDMVTALSDLEEYDRENGEGPIKIIEV